jgi:hypothetical protein
MKTLRLRVVYDGGAESATLVDADSGEPVAFEGCEYRWDLLFHQGRAHVRVLLRDLSLEPRNLPDAFAVASREDRCGPGDVQEQERRIAAIATGLAHAALEGWLGDRVARQAIEQLQARLAVRTLEEGSHATHESAANPG